MSVYVLHDWKVWDNTEPVRARSRRTVNGRKDWAVCPAPALRRSVGFKDIAGGIYTSQDLVWCVPRELVDPIGGVKPSDVIEDASDVQWSVLECPLNTHRSWYRCVCRNLVLAYDLRDAIDIWAPTNGQDAQGNRSPTMAALYSSIPGRLQPVEGIEQEMFGKVAIVKSYTCYLASQLTVAEDLAITNEMQVRIHGASTAYQIKGWRNAARVGDLFEIDVEIVP